MSNYRELNTAFMRATQAGQLTKFIYELNADLQYRPRDYLSRLFIARAYASAGELDDAVRAYQYLLGVSDPNHPNRKLLLEEIRAFAITHGRTDLTSMGSDPALTSTDATRSTHVPRTDTEKTVVDGVQNLQNGIRSFQEGSLEAALNYFLRAHRAGEKSEKLFLMLGQTLQRLGRFSEAHHWVDQGLWVRRNHPRFALMNLKAQVYSTQRLWDRAAETYEMLLTGALKPTVKQFTTLQLVRIYHRLGNVARAKELIEELLRENPSDSVLLRQKSVLEHPFPPAETSSELEGEESSLELQVDIPDEGVDLISPMLQKDLAFAQFRDEKILIQGGQPDPADADRLLQQAERARGSEFGERYPLFLESAKAYNECPPGSYELQNFYRALTRYAMMKGGAIVSELRRKLRSDEPDLSEVRRLRDSAASYYLESLTLQVRVDPRYSLIPFLNHLRGNIAVALRTRGLNDVDFVFNEKFPDLLRFGIENADDDVASVCYESLISWGAASGSVWNGVQTLKGGPGFLGGMLRGTKSREKPYKLLSQLVGKTFLVSQRPGEVLKDAFLERRRQRQEIHTFFNNVQQLALDPKRFRELNEMWLGFRPASGAFLDTDFEIWHRAATVLATLSPFQIRSPEERTAILFTARSTIEGVLRFVREYPTYWGRIVFEPLLLRWQTALRSVEKRRLQEIQPRLTVRLEPPVFRLVKENVEGGLTIANEGRGTAEGCSIRLRIEPFKSSLSGYEHEEDLTEEISANGRIYYPLRIPLKDIPDGALAPHRLRVSCAPVFRRDVLEGAEYDFTMEVESEHPIEIDEIPWNEVQIPPEQLFKGRGDFIETLARHIFSRERSKTYILYGLTRTGKSSILRYLATRIDLQPVTIEHEERRIISFAWDLGDAKSQSNARDMWAKLLSVCTLDKIAGLADEGSLDSHSITSLNRPTPDRFRSWELILRELADAKLYPVFLIDEFSYYRELVDSKRIDSSFLAAIRKFAIEGKASFVFAGTYELKKLVKDPAYGITGQLVNAIEKKVSRIERQPAIELIQVMEPQLRFTPDAVEHILALSYQIPYFIQIICKNCAILAVQTGRTIIGVPELETVTQLLTGERADHDAWAVTRLGAVAFQNNMHTPTDSIEYQSVLTTIAYLNHGKTVPRWVTYPEIQEVWHRHGVQSFQARLSLCVQQLADREVLIAGDDEGIPAYRISVDVFRRWWAVEHRFLEVELDALKDER